MRARAWAGAAGGVALAAAAVGARAQTADVQRPRTLVVGTPANGARTDRIDAARSGRSGTALPLAEGGGLRIEWRVAAGPTDVAPVVDARGTTYVVGTRGEVVAIARDGSERWRIATGAIQPSAPALLSDDTLVFTDAAGEALAVREGVVRWRVRFGRSEPAPPAPMALDDGGVVVSTSRDVAALDADGHERGRTTLPEPMTFPLVSAVVLGAARLVAVTASGAVWSFVPGASEVTRIASFGGPIDDGAALADDHTLLAIAGGRQHLVAVDLLRGTATTRAVTPTGLWLGPPSMTAGTAHLLLQAPTSELALAVDASGAETSRALLTTHPPPVSADGGAAPLVALPHTPLLVDAAGTVAFATAEGSVGVVSGGVVDLLADVCPPPPGQRGAVSAVAALAPLGPGAFVAACRSGILLSVRSGGSGEKPPPHL